MALTVVPVVKAVTLKSGADSRGFTLLEVMLVLAIIGMAALLVGPNLTGMEARNFNAQVREANALLNHARRTAVVRGVPASAVFIAGDAEQDGRGGRGSAREPARTGRGEVGQWHADAVQIAFRDSTQQRSPIDERVEVSFYPEGGSTGGELIFTLGERTAVIRIDPFSGRVSTALDEV